MTKQELHDQALKLPVRDRYELAQTLLESVPPEDELVAVPIYDWQARAVEKALAGVDERPEAVRPADEVEAEIRAGLNRTR